MWEFDPHKTRVELLKMCAGLSCVLDPEEFEQYTKALIKKDAKKLRFLLYYSALIIAELSIKEMSEKEIKEAFKENFGGITS
jgi:hypothetical protein